MLRVTEIFRSIQGESTHAGRPCTFVRLTGCPMRCVWCDSEYTFTGGEYFALDDVMKKVREFGCELVEVTGGEPLAQREAFVLIEQLCTEGFEVLVEQEALFQLKMSIRGRVLSSTSSVRLLVKKRVTTGLTWNACDPIKTK